MENYLVLHSNNTVIQRAWTAGHITCSKNVKISFFQKTYLNFLPEVTQMVLEPHQIPFLEKISKNYSSFYLI